MPVTSTLMANGSWSVQLSPQLPAALKDALAGGFFGHVAIATGRQDPRVAGDSLLTSARYVGVVNGVTFKTAAGPVLSGEGMSLWLASAAGVGDVLETQLNFTAAGVGTVVAALLPSSVHSGTIHSIGAATYTGGFVWKNRRDALTSFCQQVSTGSGPTQAVEWRVNGNATLDFGHVSDLYVTSPVTAIVARDAGVDMAVRGLPGVTQLAEDTKDFTSRVVVLAGGSGASTAVGVANLADIGATNPYTDLFGNAVKMTRMVSASSISSLNATASAQIALAPYATPRDQLQLSSSEYDILGELAVGDYTWVYDPDAGMVDFTQEITFRGRRINPVALRVIEQTWPVTPGMSVAFRAPGGTWYDLTDYVLYDSGDTSIVVGGYNRQLVSTSEPVGPRPIPDTTVPNAPVFAPFTTTSYTGPADGKSKAQIQVSWSTPTNTDGTTITDGAHYEIQYRPDLGIYAKNPTHASIAAAGYTHAALNALGGTHDNLIPPAVSQWKVTFVAWGINTVLIQELTPGVNYDFQIAAVDTASPPNRSAFSATTTVQAAADTVPPPTPDAPTVAANMASVQVTWDCGRASGGTYNQAPDLHHIEVHGSYEPLFVPVDATRLGNVVANAGNIGGQIPVVASFTLPPGQPPAQTMFIKIVAVDATGNKSQPSASAGATAVLWSDGYITDLSVSKLTAGTITASVILGSSIGTATAGQRCVMDYQGFHSYDANGNLIFDVSDTSPVVTLGRNGTSSGSITLDTSFTYPTIYFNPTSGVNKAFINAVALGGGGVGLGLNAGSFTSAYDSSTVAYRVYMTDSGGASLQCIDSAQGSHGGMAQVTDLAARLGFYLPSSTVAERVVNSDGSHTAVGTYQNNPSADAHALWFTGNSSVLGFSAASIAYGPTMAGTCMPVPGVRDVTGGTATRGCYLSASSSTQFTIAWNSTTVTHCMWWMPRWP